MQLGLQLRYGIMLLRQWSVRAACCIHGSSFLPWSYVQDGRGLSFSTLHDGRNGMALAMIIMAAQWPVLLLLAWYLGQVLPSGAGKDLEDTRCMMLRKLLSGLHTDAYIGPADGTCSGPIWDVSTLIPLFECRVWNEKGPFVLPEPVPAPPRLSRRTGLRRVVSFNTGQRVSTGGLKLNEAGLSAPAAQNIWLLYDIPASGSSIPRDGMSEKGIGTAIGT